jgi:hypothetical protein
MNASTEKSSAGSNFRNVNNGNGGWTLGGKTTVDTAARPPNTAAPHSVTLRLENKPSSNETTNAGHRRSQLLNSSIMTILLKKHNCMSNTS